MFIPKYRRKVLYEESREEVRDVLRRLAGAKDGVELVEGSVCRDHFHMSLRIAPEYGVAKVLGYLKGKSAMIMFDHHREWRRATGRDRTLWAHGYFVSTVGLNEATTRRYVRD